MNINYLAKEKTEMEIFIRSDLDRFKNFELIYSHSDVSLQSKIDFVDKHIDCNYALVQISTNEGQHTKFLSCNVQSEEEIHTSDYKTAVFTPNLSSNLKKVHIVQNHDGLTSWITNKLWHKSKD